MGIDYLHRMSGNDFGLADVIKAGDRVRHYGTKQWGTVTKVIPQHDKTAELLIKRDPPRFGPTPADDQTQWATYHCDRYEPAPQPPEGTPPCSSL